MEGPDLGIASFTLVVVADDGFERGGAAVMEIGGGLGDLTKAWGFEKFAVVEAASPGLVELFVGQVGTEVARNAAGFAAEKLQALLLLNCKGGAVAGEVAVIGRVAGEDGSDVAGQGAAEFLLAYRLVLGNGIQAGDGFVEREAHFYWVRYWLDHLLFERRGTAVPEKGLAPGAVEDARGAARADLIIDAFGAGMFVGEGAFRVVASGAGDGVVFGEAFVEEEFAAEVYGFGVEGIVVGDGDVGIEAKGDFEGEEEEPEHLGLA